MPWLAASGRTAPKETFEATVEARLFPGGLGNSDEHRTDHWPGFEEHFLFSQREEGMPVLGQFEVVDAPNRFVWIRGFESMAARKTPPCW